MSRTAPDRSGFLGLVQYPPAFAVGTQANEQIAEQGRFALEQVLFRLEPLRVAGELEESLPLAGVDSQAGSDPVSGLAWRHGRELIDDRTIAASVLGDSHDRDDVL